MMGDAISKGIKSLLAFTYGLFTVVLYALIAIKKGTFFKKRTERQNLELQLGQSSISFFTSFLPTPITSF